jgi:hypothetical protein
MRSWLTDACQKKKTFCVVQSLCMLPMTTPSSRWIHRPPTAHNAWQNPNKPITCLSPSPTFKRRSELCVRSLSLPLIWDKMIHLLRSKLKLCSPFRRLYPICAPNWSIFLQGIDRTPCRLYVIGRISKNGFTLDKRVTFCGSEFWQHIEPDAETDMAWISTFWGWGMGWKWIGCC